MFGALKRFFSNPAAPEQPPIPTAQPQPAASPVPSAAPLPAPAPPPAGIPIVATTVDGVITLPLASILASLPPNLAALVASPGDGTFSIPVKTALAQLASGAVRIPFGELRQASSPGIFYDNATQDRSLVTLPLPQILASIDPALLARRPGQKLVTVPEGVTSIFGRGRTLSAPVAAAPEAVRPAAPVSAPKPSAPESGTSRFTRPPAPAPLPSMTPKTVAPAPAPIPFPAPKPAVLPSFVPPVAEKEVLMVALSAISESWPQPVLQTIAEFQLQSATVSLPISRLESALKTGRVVFTWGDLSQWLQPPPPENSSANRGVELELPLKLVAPLFLSRQRPGVAPRKLTGVANVPSHIPDIFGRLPGAPEAAVPAPAPTVAPAPPTVTPPATSVSLLGDIFGLPGKSDWPPPEICQRICALEGVAGSLLAASDGLVVAAQLPAAFNAETMAAFLPQIFGRVSQSAGAMQLGPVTGLILAAGQARCAIYKTGSLYLTVLGHPGAALPEAVLGRIAVELAKRNP